MLQRTVLQARRLPQVFQKRGMAALKNWKKPSMDEYVVPTESWNTVNARKQQRYNLILLAGVATLTVTILIGKAKGYLFLYTTPYHLLDKKN